MAAINMNAGKMMKNEVLSRLFLLIGTILIILCCFMRNEAQHVVNAEMPPSAQYYPQVDWANYDTLPEKVAAIQIPKEQLDNMSTEKLLEALIVYPLWRWDIMPSLEEAYDQMYSECNVLREFVSRPEAGEEITKRLDNIEKLYETSEISKTEYVWGKYYFETILANLEEQ